MHLIKPVLLPVTCCMLRSCVLPELCLSCARLTVSVKTLDSLRSGRGAGRGRASRVSPRFGPLPLVVLRCRVLSCFKRTPEVVWAFSHPAGLFHLSYSLSWQAGDPRDVVSCQSEVRPKMVVSGPAFVSLKKKRTFWYKKFRFGGL